MFMFYIHLLCLVNPGDGDGFMSAEFQSTLNSKGMASAPADIAFGSKISLRHWNTQGGYLHSHNHMYPTGSKQQQITLYPHKDDNNVWVVENQTAPENGVGYGGFDAISPPINVKDGDTIKLYHTPTHRRLHSHDVRPPVTEADWQNEVSAYGYQGFEGDANDYFRVEIIKSMSDGPIAKERLRTIDTKFRLVHTMTGCVLFSHKVKLPTWGYEQQEVTCAKQGTLPNSVWYIESNDHPQLQGPDVEKVNYKNPGFFGKFIELQKVMWRTNAGLVESHAWDSRPPSWPILKRGINFWGKNNRQIYLIGNPIIWWSSTLAIVAYVLFKGIATLRWQRGFNDYNIENFRRYDFEVGATVLGWAFHYFPFFLMQRQLFLHHYFPALFFAIIALCQGWDFIFARVQLFGLRNKPSVGLLATVVYLAISIVAFYLYAPLTYGNMWTKQECSRVKIFDKWDWDCNNFHDSYAKYSNEHLLGDAVPTGAATQQAVQPAGGAPEAPQAPAQSAKPDINQAQAPVAAPPGGSIIKREERVEYRDQNGNLIPEDQIKELEGKVEFQTRYETRTRLVDAAGNEISPEQAEQQIVDGEEDDSTPEHAEAIESETEGAPVEREEAQTVPEQAPVDINTKSRRFEQGAGSPEPASAADIETGSVADASSSKETKTIVRSGGSIVSSGSAAAASVAAAGSSNASSAVNAGAASASSIASAGSSGASSVASSASNIASSSVKSASSVVNSVADAGTSSVVSAASAASSAGSSVVGNAAAAGTAAASSVSSAGTVAASSASSAGTVVASSASSIAKDASASVVNAASGASSVGSSVVDNATASVKSAASGASSVGSSVASGASSVGSSVVDNATVSVKSAASGASSVGSSVVEGAAASIRSAASAASSVGASVVDKAASAGTVVASSASSVADNASANVRSAASDVSSAGSSVASGASASVQSAASGASASGASVVNHARASANSAASGVSSVGSSVVSGASSVGSSVVSGASSVGSSVVDNATASVRSAASNVSSAGSSVASGASASAESVVSVASSATDSIIDEAQKPVTRTETKTEIRSRETVS